MTPALHASSHGMAGFLVDEVTWAIRYLVVDTSNWWLGKKLLVAPADKPDALLDRAWELRLHAHYGRTGDWIRDEPQVTRL